MPRSAPVTLNQSAPAAAASSSAPAAAPPQTLKQSTTITTVAQGAIAPPVTHRPIPPLVIGALVFVGLGVAAATLPFWGSAALGLVMTAAAVASAASIITGVTFVAPFVCGFLALMFIWAIISQVCTNKAAAQALGVAAAAAKASAPPADEGEVEDVSEGQGTSASRRSAAAAAAAGAAAGAGAGAGTGAPQPGAPDPK